MGRTLPADLVERIIARYPLPIADAVAALISARDVHERRDRVVECFRAHVRFCAVIALAARGHAGEGPRPMRPAGRRALRRLRSQPVTDGQWVSLVRELLYPWARNPDAHPVPELVRLFWRNGRPVDAKLIDGLLKMRRCETVAHGDTGDEARLRTIMARRVPQLVKVLERSAALWQHVQLVAAPRNWQLHRADLLMGDTPARGRWRQLDIALEAHHAGRLLLATGRTILELEPIAVFARAKGGAFSEVFVLDNCRGDDANYVALPSMTGLRRKDLIARLDVQVFGLSRKAVADDVKEHVAAASARWRAEACAPTALLDPGKTYRHALRVLGEQEALFDPAEVCFLRACERRQRWRRLRNRLILGGVAAVAVVGAVLRLNP